MFGELLYARLFGSHPTPITLEAFLKISSTLEKTVGECVCAIVGEWVSVCIQSLLVVLRFKG